MMSQGNPLWKTPEGIYSGSEGSFQGIFHLERPFRPLETHLKGLFKGYFPGTSLTVHSAWLLFWKSNFWKQLIRKKTLQFRSILFPYKKCVTVKERVQPFQIPLLNYPGLEAMPLPLRPAWSMTSAAWPATAAAELPRPKAALTAATWSDTGIVPNSWDTPTDIWESSRAWMAAISACSAFPRAVAVLKFF